MVGGEGRSEEGPAEAIAGAARLAYGPPRAPVAQLDRALPSEGRGRTFESCRVRHPTIGRRVIARRSVRNCPRAGRPPNRTV